MRTPSLRRRVVAGGVLVLVAVLLASNALVYGSFREGLEASLDEILDARADLAADLAAGLPPPQAALVLARAGIPATVVSPSSALASLELRAPRGVEGPVAARAVDLGNDVGAVVFASAAQQQFSLRRLVVVLATGTLVAAALAALLLQRVAAVALRPLDGVVGTAREIAAGRTGRRLEPDDERTELGRLAVAFDEMLDALERAVADARASEERSRDFLAYAAHQLRTPVAGLSASAETLLRAPPDAERDRLLANIARESNRVGRLVASLLRMVRLEQGEPLERRPTDVAALARAELDRLESLSPGLGVELTVGEGAAEPVGGDPEALREALANVLDNARRHARSAVAVGVRRTPTGVEVRVTDDGPGVPAGAEERIFERFVTLEGPGSGLGLPIARRIARAHGGDLRWEGGSFVLAVPAGES